MQGRGIQLAATALKLALKNEMSRDKVVVTEVCHSSHQRYRLPVWASVRERRSQAATLRDVQRDITVQSRLPRRNPQRRAFGSPMLTALSEGPGSPRARRAWSGP